MKKTVKEMFTNTKLHVLRCGMIAATTVADVATNFVANEYHYPVQWLRHFLLGSGKDMQVPDMVVDNAMDALIRAISVDSYRTIRDKRTVYGKFCVNTSTLYEGSGFHGRPTLFYLLGGFTFELSLDSKRNLIISGTDEYDWHSDGSGRYFSSPLGNNGVIKAVCGIMGKIFGEDLICVGPNKNMIYAKEEENDARISNKLWECMYQVGAKSFNSYFKLKVDKRHWKYIIRVFHNTLVIDAVRTKQKEWKKAAKENVTK